MSLHVSDDRRDGWILINILNLCEDLINIGKGYRFKRGISCTDGIMQK